MCPADRRIDIGTLLICEYVYSLIIFIRTHLEKEENEFYSICICKLNCYATTIDVHLYKKRL